MYTNEEGTRYLNQHVSYLLGLQINPSEKRDSVHNFNVNNTGDGFFTFPEGRIELGAILPDGRRDTRVFFIDGTAPVPGIVFEGEQYRSNNGTMYLGPPAIVDFRATDALSGVQQILVSVNGARFIDHDMARGLIRDEGKYAIQYYAVDNVGNVSNTFEADFIIDLTAPEVMVSIPVDRLEDVISERSEIILISSDGRSGVRQTLFRIAEQGDAAFRTYAQPIGLATLEEGFYTLEYFSRDLAGNIGDTLSFGFYLDKTPPAIDVSLVGPAYEQNNTLFISEATQIVFDTFDDRPGVGWLSYTINDLDSVVYEQPVGIKGESGIYTIRYRASDRVNNISDYFRYRVFLDNNPPQVWYTFNDAYRKVDEVYETGQNSRVTLQAEDLETGYAYIEYQILGPADPTEPTTGSHWIELDTPIMLNQIGLFTVNIRAFDALGNYSEPQVLRINVLDDFGAELTSDAIAQRIQSEAVFHLDNDRIFIPGNEPIYLFLSSDPFDLSGEYMLGGIVPASSPELDQMKPIVAPRQGSTIMEFNLGGDRQIFATIADKTAPVTTLQTIENRSTIVMGDIVHNTSVAFDLSAVDQAGGSGVRSILIATDNDRFTTFTDPISGFVSQQEYLIRYYATDQVGNSEIINEHRFMVDDTPPRTRIRIIENYSGSLLSPNSRLELVSTDNLAGVDSVYYRFNEETSWEHYQGNIILSRYENAFSNQDVQRIHFYAVDKVGNRESSSSFSFRFQNRIPELGYVWSGRAAKTNDVYFVRTGTTLILVPETRNVGMRSLEYRFVTGAYLPYERPIQPQTGTSGTYRFRLIDELGNMNESLQVRYFSDNTPPRSSLALNGRQIVLDGRRILGQGANVSITSSDAGVGLDRTLFRQNDERAQTYNGPISFQRSGSYVIRYWGVDRLGNEEEEETIRFDVDMTPPEIDLVYNPQPIRRMNDGTIVIRPQSFIIITANDEMTEVSSLVYRINEGEPTPYSEPLTGFRSGQRFSLTVIVTDLLENTRTARIQFVVE